LIAVELAMLRKRKEPKRKSVAEILMRDIQVQSIAVAVYPNGGLQPGFPKDAGDPPFNPSTDYL
jgi:hypothetical protein